MPLSNPNRATSAFVMMALVVNPAIPILNYFFLCGDADAHQRVVGITHILFVFTSKNRQLISASKFKGCIAHLTPLKTFIILLVYPTLSRAPSDRSSSEIPRPIVPSKDKVLLSHISCIHTHSSVLSIVLIF